MTDESSVHGSEELLPTRLQVSVSCPVLPNALVEQADELASGVVAFLLRHPSPPYRHVPQTTKRFPCRWSLICDVALMTASTNASTKLSRLASYNTLADRNGISDKTSYFIFLRSNTGNRSFKPMAYEDR